MTLDPERLLPPEHLGDERQLLEAQVRFQNALWMALLRPWPQAAFWAQFWRSLYPQWPRGKTWPAPQLEFFTVGIRFTPDISVMAVRVLLGKGSPHPAAVRIYTPSDRYDALALRSPRLLAPLSEYGTAWSWRTRHHPFPAPIEPDEIFVPTRPNPMLRPVAHALAALQPSEEEFAVHTAHWAAYLEHDAPGAAGASVHRPGVTPLLSRAEAAAGADVDADRDADVDPDEGAVLAPDPPGTTTGADEWLVAHPRVHVIPSVSIRLTPEQKVSVDAGGVAGVAGVAGVLDTTAGDPATQQVWETLRSALEAALRRDQELFGAVADTLVGLRRQLDVQFDAQCQAPGVAIAWKRDEAVRWARQVARRHDERESVRPLLKLAHQQSLEALATGAQIAVEAAVKRVYALATHELPQCEAWVTGRLEMPEIVCAALNRGDHPWLPAIAGRRRCPRCGKEETAPDDVEHPPVRDGSRADIESAARPPVTHASAGQSASIDPPDEDDWLR